MPKRMTIPRIIRAIGQTIEPLMKENRRPRTVVEKQVQAMTVKMPIGTSRGLGRPPCK